MGDFVRHWEAQNTDKNADSHGQAPEISAESEDSIGSWTGEGIFLFIFLMLWTFQETEVQDGGRIYLVNINPKQPKV